MCKGSVKRPEDRRWSSSNSFALGKATVAAGLLQIDDVGLPLGYRAREKPMLRTALNLAALYHATKLNCNCTLPTATKSPSWRSTLPVRGRPLTETFLPAGDKL